MTAFESATDGTVLKELDNAVRQERECTGTVLRWLIQFERRRLLGRVAYDSLYAYCTGHLGYSLDEAHKRIRAARAAAKRPEIIDLIESRKTDLSRVVTVCPHLDSGDADALLRRACTMSQRDLESFVAGLAPKTAGKDVVRPLRQPDPALQPLQSPQSAPAPTPPFSGSNPAAEESASAPRLAAQATTAPSAREAVAPASSLGLIPPFDRVQPITQKLSRISFTADQELVNNLDRACAILRCRRGNVGPVFGRALKLLLQEIDPALRFARSRTARSSRPSMPHSRHIPLHVRRSVWKRDGGQCTFRDASGKRCEARTELQFDHIEPWGAGGPSNDSENIRLLCRNHNLAQARRCYGDEKIDAAIAARRAGYTTGRPSPGVARPPP